MRIRKLLIMLFSVSIFLSSAAVFAYSPYAAEVVSSIGLPATSLYNDPMAVLGKPSIKFNNGWGSNVDIRKVKLVEPAYNKGDQCEKLITTLNLNQSITVKFDHQIIDDPLNPYGLDFIAFGNSFFSGSGFVSDTTNMNTYKLNGLSAENVKISVSQDNVNWYCYENGPYADGLFPTNAYKWDRENAVWTNNEMDFTKPVDPSFTSADFKGLSGADAIDLYQGSAGGTGFDLAYSGLSWIQYIKVEGSNGFSGGEIDGFSDVAAVPEPSSILTLSSMIIGFVGIRRRKQKNIC